MPVTTPEIKVEAVRRMGGMVELVGESYSETQAYAQVPLLVLSNASANQGISHCACMPQLDFVSQVLCFGSWPRS